MSDPDLAAARNSLLAERDRLRRELAEGITTPGAMTYGSQAAAASQVFEQQRELALRDQARHHLELVEAALGRIEEGTFGTCQRCHRQIAPERLEVLPWATYCIECQREIGRGR